MSKKATKEEINKIIELRKKGYSYYRIHKDYGFDNKMCRKICVLYGVDTDENRSHKRYTADEKDDIICSYNDGEDIEDIASRYDRPIASIRGVLYRNGAIAKRELERKKDVTELPYVIKIDPKPIKRVTYEGKKYIETWVP